MKVKHLFQLIFFVCLIGCAGKSYERPKKSGPTRIGLSIENGQRQGMQYFDSAKVEYNYRYYTMTITNDTSLATQIEIGIPDSEISSSNRGRSKIFILPRHLTPKKQQMDVNGISKELKQFLDCEIGKPVHLSKVIGPTEKCVVTFGVLTDIKFEDPTTPFDTKLLTSTKNPSGFTFELQINDTLIIPCGHFSYVEK